MSDTPRTDEHYRWFGSQSIKKGDFFVKMTTEQIQIACAECEGWTNVEPRYDTVDIGKVPNATRLRGHRPFSGPHANYHPTPNYPIDPAAALTLVESLAKEGITFIGQSWKPGKDRPPWHVTFITPRSVAFYGEADTLPLAICRAYLKVRGKL